MSSEKYSLSNKSIIDEYMENIKIIDEPTITEISDFIRYNAYGYKCSVKSNRKLKSNNSREFSFDIPKDVDLITRIYIPYKIEKMSMYISGKLIDTFTFRDQYKDIENYRVKPLYVEYMKNDRLLKRYGGWISLEYKYFPTCIIPFDKISFDITFMDRNIDRESSILLECIYLTNVEQNLFIEHFKDRYCELYFPNTDVILNIEKCNVKALNGVLYDKP